MVENHVHVIAMHFWYCIHLLIHILMCLFPVFSNLLRRLSERERERETWLVFSTVKSVMHLDHSVIVYTVFRVLKRETMTYDDDVNWKLKKRLVLTNWTAKADTLVQGIRVQDPVLEWGGETTKFTKKKDLESYSFSDGAVETVIVFVYETCNSLCTSFLWLDGSSFFLLFKGGGGAELRT